MDTPPWVTITHTGDSALQTHPYVLANLPLEKSSTPQFVSFIGKHEKTHVLRHLLLSDKNLDIPHGQVYLWSDPITRSTKTPTIFIDCELHSSSSTQWQQPVSYLTPKLSTRISWLSYGDQASVRTYFTTNVLFPISSILYYFAADLGGTTNVIDLLVQQLAVLPLCPEFILPTTVIITDDFEDLLLHDVSIKFNQMLVKAFRLVATSHNESEAKAIIKSRFGTLQAMSSGNANRFARANAIRAHMQSSLDDFVKLRRGRRYLFSFSHLQAFSTTLLSRFCSDQTTAFSFIQASRPAGFDASQLVTHLQDVLGIMPSEAWLWHFVAPMLASCLLVSLYPPDSHRLFMPTRCKALSANRVQFSTQFLHIKNYFIRRAVRQ